MAREEAEQRVDAVQRRRRGEGGRVAQDGAQVRDEVEQQLDVDAVGKLCDPAQHERHQRPAGARLDDARVRDEELLEHCRRLEADVA